jgi:hypothetical protein
MDIHQLNLSYLPAEDRLLLRVSTRQGSEFAAWLTRKLTLGLWQALQACAQNHAARSYAGKSDVSDPMLRKELAEFSSTKHLQAADFNTPYQPVTPPKPNYANYGTQRPQQTPLLPTEVILEARAEGRTHMQLKEADRQLAIMLDETLLHAIMQLVVKTVEQADWGVALKIAETDTNTHSNKPLMN